MTRSTFKGFSSQLAAERSYGGGDMPELIVGQVGIERQGEDLTTRRLCAREFALDVR